jgi:hypothetical protein
MNLTLKPSLNIHQGLRMAPRLRRHISADALRAKTLLPKRKGEQDEESASIATRAAFHPRAR